MFVLSQIEHNLPMPPHLLNRPLADAIKAELERLFLDKVVANLGLCVSVYDIRSVEGGFIFPGEGCSTYKVSFRLLMFRPLLGRFLLGRSVDMMKRVCKFHLIFSVIHASRDT